MLAGVLALTLASQLLLPDAVALPPAGPIGAGALLPRVADPAPRGVPGAVLARPIFAPSGAPAGGGTDGETVAAADPLGGATIAGFIGVGRARAAIVSQDGRVRRVGIGGTIAGWRLVGLTAEGAVLARGGERLRRGFAEGAGGDSASEQNSEETE